MFAEVRPPVISACCKDSFSVVNSGQLTTELAQVLNVLLSVNLCLAVQTSMARPLQVLSLLCRLGAPSVSSSTFCRFASRGVSKVGQSRVLREKVSGTASRYNNEMCDEKLGLEDVEAKLQALVE